MAYLHGAETIEKEKNNFIIQDADLSAIAVIGTMPTYLIDNPAKVTKIDVANYTAQIGNNLSGFTLPDAVETILKESGGAEIYAINIFDPQKHTAHVNKNLEFTDFGCTLTEKNILNLVLKQNDEVLTYGEDYEFTANTIIILGEDADNITAEYDYADFTKITDADVIGVDDNGERTGLQAVLDVIAEWGKTPGILIAPGFSSKNVRTAFEVMAEKLKSFCYLDTPEGTKVGDIEKARLKEQNNGLDLTTTSDRIMLFAPYVKRYNQYEDKTELKPISPVLAGLRVKLDNERNVAKSIDNTKTITTTGMEFPISFILDDPTTDSNRINATGVGTVINRRGEFRVWGSRNTKYPSSSGIKTFESTRRTQDLIEKSIQEAEFVLIGENITKAFIDNVLAVINSKFASWSSGSEPLIYGGEARYDETLNTAETIADGHVYFPYEFCPVSPVERITNYGILDISFITKALNA